MRDTDLYGQILGLQAPWAVKQVDLDVAKARVDIWLEHEEGWRCVQCERELPCRDHAEERVWRHLDTCQFGTYVHARIPRVDCPEHGVAQVSVPWASPRSPFTLLMEALGDRCAQAVRHHRGSTQVAAAVLGRAVGHYAAGGGARSGAQAGAPMPWQKV